MVKKANPIVFWILRVLFTPALYLLYRFRFDRKTSKNVKSPCLILSNHQAVFDQFGVAVGFNFGINFIASDSIFRYGLKSKLMKAIARPIPFSKGSSDLSAIRNMMLIIKDGGAIGMFPSGNRSIFGDECRIVPGIGKLAKMLKVPLVLVQIRGGFNAKPRWKIKTCKGKVRASVTRILSPEELAAKNASEIDEVILKELNFNEFEYNKNAQIIYRGQRKAEYLESVLFYCPLCNNTNSLYSKGNELICNAKVSDGQYCGMRVRINNTGFFEKPDKTIKLPDTILEWSKIQLEYIKRLNYNDFTDKPIFSDDNIVLYIVERAKKETVLGKGTIEFYTDKMTICGQDFLHTETTTALQGVRKLTIYNKDNVYAAVSPFKINLLKYMICGYHLRNITLGTSDVYYGY